MDGRQLEFGQEIKENIDSHGNRWYMDGNIILLKLFKEKNPRKIGTLFDNRLITFRNRAKHLMKSNNSYGFNEEVIKSIDVEYIDLYEDIQMFRIPRQLLLEGGQTLEEQGDGYEKQLFLSISEIEKHIYVAEEDVKRIELLGEEWFYKLKEEFNKSYMIMIGRTVAAARAVRNIYPSRENMFRAYKETPFSEIKVVIVGQDPYYNKDIADGLAFSSGLATYLPPSLLTIYKAIEKDIHFGMFLDQSPNLDYLAEQGVFLLNRVLTVEQNNPGSHSNIGWQRFTGETLEKLKEHNRDLVFMLWGSEAKKCRELIDNDRHLILECEHPANASRNHREWEYYECVKKCNTFLQSRGYGQINW